MSPIKFVTQVMVVSIALVLVVAIFSLVVILALSLALGVMSCRVLRGLFSREPEVLQPGAFVEALESCRSLLPSVFTAWIPTGSHSSDSPDSTSETKQELGEEDALLPSSTRGDADLEIGLVEV